MLYGAVRNTDYNYNNTHPVNIYQFYVFCVLIQVDYKALIHHSISLAGVLSDFPDTMDDFYTFCHHNSQELSLLLMSGENFQPIHYI